MNRFLVRVLPAIGLVGILLLSGAAWSGGHRGDFDSERMIQRLTDHLALTESQQQQVEELLAAGRDSAQADYRRMQEIREALREQRQGFDAGEAQKLADELGEITSRTAFRMASHQAQLYALLTEEQREQFDEFHERREQHRGKRLGKHRE